MFLKIVQKIIQWFNKVFRGIKNTTLGEIRDNAKYWNKKILILNIVNMAGLLNGNSPVIDKDFESELRETGKKALLKTFLLLKVAYSKKLQGSKDAYP